MRPRSPRFSFAKLAPSFHRQQHIRSTSMSEIPGDLKFMKSHEWARAEGDGKVTVGISDPAQGLLGDLVYVDLPAVGDRAETRSEEHPSELKSQLRPPYAVSSLQ